MKLRNKKTGEIINNNGISFAEGNYKTYNSIDEFNEEWEDYKEPKPWWYIDITLDVKQGELFLSNYVKEFKTVGNYFETREEAEKAVEKLKAWKRLKDKGFRFEKWINTSTGPYSPIWFYFEKDTVLEDVKSDLDLLFGGEE